MDYDTIEDEIQDLIWDLQDADQATIAGHVGRLRAKAVHITDDRWRQNALERIDALPRLVAGPPLGRSPQYSQAVRLAAQVHGATGSIEERIAAAERTATEIAELARRAPADEYMVIKRMNSSIARIIDALRRGEV
jgi:hypothetical protein